MYCFVIPHYNHMSLFSGLINKLKQQTIPCVIIDDGSSPEALAELIALTEGEHLFHLFKHAQNRGKGAAVITGCYHARALGFTHIIQIDADGQHNLDDVAKFIEHSQQFPTQIISGKPFFEESAPKIRVYGRRITDLWVAIESLSFKIKDSLCGFRIYPLTETEKIIDRYHIGSRMDFDTDILVKAVWANIDLHYIPTKVIYHENSVSHFHYLRDNLLLIRLHVRLLVGMIIQSPILLGRRLKNLMAK